MQLFIHIPKTAGTSLRNAMQRRYGKRIAYAYGDNILSHPLLATAGRPSEQRAALEAQGIELIFGHVERLHWQSAFDQREMLSVLRNPVDRCLSHYQHYLSHHGNQDPLAKQVCNGQMTLQAFARHPTITNMQARMLAVDFDSLSRLFEFGGLFTGEQLASELGVKQRLNTTRRTFQVTPDDIIAIHEANRLDLQIYELVRQAWREGYWRWNYILRPPVRRFFIR